MRTSTFIAAAIAAAVAAAASRLVRAQTPVCGLSAYKAQTGLTAAAEPDGVAIVWDGGAARVLRLRLGIVRGIPTIRELAVRKRFAIWTTLAADGVPDFRVVTGVRRMSNQQLQPLRGLGVDITPQIVDEKKWDAFWDAPLDLNPQAGSGRGGNPPPTAGIANQPGLPRKPDEVSRASARFRTTGCSVKTDGARIEVSYPGVELGVFSGRLQFTVYRGTGLIRMEVVAKTDAASGGHAWIPCHVARYVRSVEGRRSERRCDEASRGPEVEQSTRVH